MSDTKDLTVPFEKFEPERLTFTDLEENDRSKGQLISYPRYNHPVKGENQPLMLQASWSKLFTYGVPRAGEYYKTDYDRSFLKLPIDSDNQQQMELVSKLEAIDELYGSEKKKKQMFGKKYKKYEYNKIVRESQSDDDVDRPRYIKLKLETAWPNGEILTKVYRSELKDVNGKEKRVRTHLEVTTIDDFADNVRYLSKVRPIIRPVKMWAQPATRKDPGYGIVFKIVKIEVEPNQSGGSSLKDYYNNDAFLDSDDDDEVANVGTVDSDEEVAANVDSDSSDSDSDSDSDDDVKVKKKKKKTSSA